MAASASTYSLGNDDAALGVLARLTPTGSLRHSRHSSRRSSKRSSASEVSAERDVICISHVYMPTSMSRHKS